MKISYFIVVKILEVEEKGQLCKLKGVTLSLTERLGTAMIESIGI